MKRRIIQSIFLLLASFFCYGISQAQEVKGQNVIYKDTRDSSYQGYISYNTQQKGKRPVVLVVPEWWGINDYSRHRADMLAGLGYFAFTLDFYGNGRIAENPAAAGALATPFYKDPQKAADRFRAALEWLKNYPEADLSQVAAIGYCFGGSMVLNGAKLNLPFKGIVSFHGGLKGLPAPRALATKMLICHGAADSFISTEEINSFRSNLDSAGVSYQFISYPDATHAFTNPDATATGQKFGMPIRYNEAADKKSWEDMKQFLYVLF